MKPLHQAAATLALPVVLSCAVWAQTSAPAPKAYFVSENSPAVRDMLRYANYAINRIGVSLVREVNSSLAHKSPEEAVDVCHLKDLPVVNGTVAGMPRITAMKLTSLKVRNPANQPDASERTALERIQFLLNTEGAPPDLLIQRVEPADGPAVWFVYKPLGIMNQCMTCHGDPMDQSKALRTKLHQLYPNDEAADYRPGQWRGVIRVTVADQ